PATLANRRRLTVPCHNPPFFGLKSCHKMSLRAVFHLARKRPMKMLVLGATGGTGLEIVRRGVQQGQSVTAFVRSPERLKPFGDHITIRQGNLLNSAELEKVIDGHDVVVSGFGPRVPISKADANLLQQFATALTRAMQHTAVRRVVIES